MTLAINNNTTAQRPAFGGLAIFGNGRAAYLASMTKEAAQEFVETVDKKRHWGFVNINKTDKPDTFELEGFCDSMGTPIKTKFTLKDGVDFVLSKIQFLVDNEKTYK